jgi:purine-nucleoside phosphorylase
MLEQIQETVEFIKKQIPNTPQVGLILGSGLGDYADSFPHPVIISYADIPHFPQTTIVGHKGRLVFQEIEGLPVVIMQGRFHYYEGYSMEQVTFPIRVMGQPAPAVDHDQCRGGANMNLLGRFMLLTDHLN